MHLGIEDETGNPLGGLGDQVLLEIGTGYTPASLESLEMACRAYFETYQATRDKVLGPAHSYDGQFRYIQLSRQTILYFHHFFELAIKDILRLEHPLLASRIEEVKGETLLGVLRNGLVDDKDLKSVEFGEALARLSTCCTLPGGKLEPYKFILDSRTALNELNILRNRIWHRGKVFVPLDALDEMVGRRLLPLALRIVESPPFGECPPRLDAEADSIKASPTRELCRLWEAQGEPDEWKVCLLKELGRVTLDSHVRIVDTRSRCHHNIARVKRIAEARSEFAGYGSELNEHSPGVKTCPACKLESLITIVWSEGDMEAVGGDFDGEMFHVEYEFRPLWAQCVEVECINCRFCLNALGFPTNTTWQGFDFVDLFWQY